MAALVDTSAWIEFFKPGGNQRVQWAVAAALEDGNVVTTSPILVELLVGLNPARAADARAIERLRSLEAVELNWNACGRAGTLGRALARRGRRIPTADLLIAGAAVAAAHEVWHVGDQHFVILAQAGGPRQRDLSMLRE